MRRIGTWACDMCVSPKVILPSSCSATKRTFEFVDGNNLSFSIEARKEEGEAYSALKGLFREYELAYTWGTERDFLTRRLLYLGNDVRMYPLELEADVVQKLFVNFVQETQSVTEKPRFYNTLTQNCTNALAHGVNELFPNSLNYDVSWNFPGSSDIFLMEEGLIATVGSPEDTREANDLTLFKKDIAELNTISHSKFSAMIREMLNGEGVIVDN